ncbi:23S rRNA (pseudouridine(1915)-N(3))-methyltransferase RlmH [Desulfogranum mediterraneum]|uniref:23S rRNA (pseudouridine(1915)-N(3))-methyltransferase RlmH n=1 Tax=Desulfogranum mediterraneum TaxID=160661 RepID=UPI0004126ED3|nr:23S rRNA (pseudouridine(1915)-N(3))-methyltransferase RlmH [Desulfogranum mediterraneum]
MNFVIPFIGKTRQKYLDQGIADYARRLGRFGRVELPLLKERSSNREADGVIKRQEAEQLLAQVGALKKGVVIALDPLGKLLDSEGLAALLKQWQGRGVGTAAFLIGGHLGLDQSVLKRADLKLSLSPLTFTHEMSRLLLIEQLYRACTINANHNYHK